MESIRALLDKIPTQFQYSPQPVTFSLNKLSFNLVNQNGEPDPKYTLLIQGLKDPHITERLGELNAFNEPYIPQIQVIFTNSTRTGRGMFVKGDEASLLEQIMPTPSPRIKQLTPYCGQQMSTMMQESMKSVTYRDLLKKGIGTLNGSVKYGRQSSGLLENVDHIEININETGLNQLPQVFWHEASHFIDSNIYHKDENIDPETYTLYTETKAFLLDVLLYAGTDRVYEVINNTRESIKKGIKKGVYPEELLSTLGRAIKESSKKGYSTVYNELTLLDPKAIREWCVSPAGSS